MAALDRILEVLPPTYAVDEGSAVREFLRAIARELDAAAADLDRMRRARWFATATRLADLDRMAALVGVRRRSWETVPLLRARVRTLVNARLDGSVGPDAITTYLHETVLGIERALGGTLVPGLARRDLQAAFRADARPGWRPLGFVENPERRVRGAALASRAGRVPYLHRWTDTNHGLGPAPVTVTVVGQSGGRTAVPVLVNLTTGEAIGYAGVARVGQRLTIGPAPGQPPDGRVARAVLADDRGAPDRDVTDRAFSLSGFRLGRPFGLADAEAGGPRLPTQARGDNRWMYVSGALFGVDGLDATYLQITDEPLREGVFDGSNFDEAVFPSGTAATVTLEWTEQEPAAFRVVIPRGLVALPRAPGGAAGAGGPSTLVGEIAELISGDLADLHAAGVRARLVLEPFTERQASRVRVRLSWMRPPRQIASAGERVRLGVGGRFGQAGFGQARFE
ncbi:hypothetical protein [Frankia gtarii]|uniref:hypothetical protein n=1 Tax=Frankia gtarii TaxID=2950102 RepID=UPI0021BE1B0C|nr:hypothetical protein [Frankia gtarii]